RYGRFQPADLLDRVAHEERAVMLTDDEQQLLKELCANDRPSRSQRESLAAAVQRVILCYADPPEPPPKAISG
ncbi:hypothetical protein, partial [Mesorhizobium sp. M1C.F.Ca.ET.193.01.1.1]